LRAKLPKLTLDENQKKAVEKIILETTRASLNASLMGTGKTVMAVESALGLGTDTNLIIGPLNTFWGWHDTIQRQTKYAAKGLHKIDSTKAGRAHLANLAKGDEGWYFIGREYFRSKDWAGYKPDMAIVDECHFAQNRHSKSHRALMRLKAGYKLSMSGTPYGNKFEGFWAVSRWLWPELVPRSFWLWATDWCEMGYSPFTKHEIEGEKESGAYANSLPSYIRLHPDKDIDTVHDVRYVDLAPAQRKIYDKFEKDLVVWLKDNPMIAEVPIAARTRLRQITLATPVINQEGQVDFDDDAVSSKYKALMEIIEDNPDEPMLLLTDSQKYARLLTRRLNKTKEQAFEWSGKANQTQREEAKQKFLKQQLSYIVAVIPAIAEGVDGLQDVCSTVVWLSHSDSNVLNQQVLDRIRRRGQKKLVRVYDIVARDTYDEGQLGTLLQTQISMNLSLRKEN
jgi:hypothetical protein